MKNLSIVNEEKLKQRLDRHGLEFSVNEDTSKTLNTETLIVQVNSSNQAIVKTKTSTEATLTTDANSLIDEIVEQIDTSRDSSINLYINFSYNFKNSDNYIADLNEFINKRFGFKMAVGSIRKSYNFCEIVTISLDSIPLFINLANASPIKLPADMLENLGEIIEIGYHQPPKSQEEVLVLLRTESTYDRWSPLLKDALFATLFDYINGADLLYADWKQKAKPSV